MPPRLLAERALEPLRLEPPKALEERDELPPKSRLELPVLARFELPPRSRVPDPLVPARLLAELVLREPAVSRVPIWLPDMSR
jgi:hypothetical protein